MTLNHRLPQEILDNIIDLLHDDPEALEKCCLVSKSWVPRTRKHLFAVVVFCTLAGIQAWKETFPDPSDSPGYHTRALIVNCPEAVTQADAEEGGWIRAFSRVVYLELDNYLSLGLYLDEESKVSLAPFHKFSPTLKSLAVASFFLSRSEVFGLIPSFPHLEDLTLIGNDIISDEPDELETVVPPSNSPALTGSLELAMSGGVAGIVRRLLVLPNGVHFQDVKMCWAEEEDIRSAAELVTGCSETLEHLDLMYQLTGTGYSICANIR